MTLQDIADDLEQRIENSSNASKTEMLTVIAELVDVLMEGASPNPKDAEVIALKAEIDSLKRQLAMSSEDAKIIEDTRTVLRQREDAPPNMQTAKMLPSWAAMFERKTL